MRKQSLFLPIVSALLLAISSLTPASAAVSNRISQSVDDTARASIANNTSPRLKSATDLGEAPSTQQIPAITIRFNLTATQQAALDQLLIDQQNPASPQYHQWLTPQQFAAQFGMSSADLAKVQAWLASKGFTVTEVAPSGLYVRATGTVGQAENAFGVKIHNVTYKGKTHIANVGDPTLPAAFASAVGSVTGLDDFKLTPHLHHVSPSYTAPSGTYTGEHFIAPGDFYTIYNENALLSSGINGSGITIGVMGQTDISTSEVAAFRSAAGLSVNNPTIQVIGTDPGFTSSSDTYEAQLDVEWAGAVAPSASILFVNSTDVIDTSLSTAITSNLAPILTISYGDCEVNYGASTLASFNTLFQEANAQGQTILGPAGDSGATDCDYDSTIASEGLSVDFPGSSPYVTSVGGSLFGTTSSPQSSATTPESSSTYWSTSNATNGTYTASVLLPIVPQSVWNETAGYGGLAAGGGGASAFFTKPYWQTGTGVPADSSRDVPDLVLNAAVLHDGSILCAPSLPYTNSSGGTSYTLADCTSGFLDSSGNPDFIGGTSVATPSFAGMLALLEQKLGGGTTGRIGNANPVLYALANSTYYANVYYDITNGNNDSPCLNGSINCPSGGGYIGYNAGTGYDRASGWGSVNAYNLVTDWKLVTPASSSSTPPDQSAVTLTTSAFSVTVGTGITLTATVASNTSGVTSTPTGTVQFYLDGTAVGSAQTLSSASASYTLSTTGLTSGGHTVSVAYSGNTTYNGSKGSALIDITATTSDFTISPSTVTMTAAPGASTSVTFTNTSVGGFQGAVYYVLSSAPDYVYFEYNVTTSTCNAGEGVGTTTIDGIPTCPVAVTPTTPGTTTFTLYAYGTSTGSTRLKPASPKAATTQPPTWYLTGSGIAVAGLLMLTLPRRRNRLGVALLAALLTAGIFTASGCSSGGTILSNGGGTTTSSGSSGYINASPGTYPIVVTAFSNQGQAHNIEVNFVVP